MRTRTPVVLPGTHKALHLPEAPQARSALQELPRERFCAREGTLLYFFAGFLHNGQRGRAGRPQLRLFCSIKFSDEYAVRFRAVWRRSEEAWRENAYTVTAEELRAKGWLSIPFERFDQERQVKLSIN